MYAKPGMSNEEMFTSLTQAAAHAELARTEGESYRPQNAAFAARSIACALANRFDIPGDPVAIESVPSDLREMDSEEVRDKLKQVQGRSGNDCPDARFARTRAGEETATGGKTGEERKVKEETTILELNDYEKRVLIEALNDRRNDLIESDRCPYDVSDLLLRVIDAPTRKKSGTGMHDEKYGRTENRNGGVPCHRCGGGPVALAPARPVPRRGTAADDSEAGGCSVASLPAVVLRGVDSDRLDLALPCTVWCFSFVIIPSRTTAGGRNTVPPIGGKIADIDRKYRQEPAESNKILTQHIAIGYDTHSHRRNLNTLVVGGSGAGKTRFYAKPNLMQANTSFVVTDPKGELLRDTGYLLERAGYKVRVLDLLHMRRSHGYNPFVYLQSDNDVQRLVTKICSRQRRRREARQTTRSGTRRHPCSCWR